MAKAFVEISVTVPCHKCGEPVHMSTTRQNRTDANKWKEWARGQEWLCLKCWDAERRAEEAAQG
jgi:hypothetical protein